MSEINEAPPPPSPEEMREILISLSLNQINMSAVMVRLIGVTSVNVIGGSQDIKQDMMKKINEVFRDTDKILDRLLGKF